MRAVRPVALATRPRVSVVIPCYDYGRYLPEAVASALDQPGVDVDVLIVDDRSTDDSAAIAQRLAAADPRVDVLLHETNRGHIRTYNDGLAAVTGEYVVLLSADDVLTHDSLGRSVALMEAHPEVGLVYGAPRDFSTEHAPADGRAGGLEGGLEAWPGATLSWSVWPGAAWVAQMCRRGRNMIRCPEAVMRTSVLREIGGYDARFPHSGDMLMWLRAAARSDVGRVNGVIQAYYRVHGRNMHTVDFGGVLDDFVARRETYREFLDSDGALLDDPDRLWRLARRRLAREALRHTQYLATTRDGIPHIPTMLDFAARLDPRDRVVRAWYAWAARPPMAGLVFRAEAHRTFLRDQRELRVGR